MNFDLVGKAAAGVFLMIALDVTAGFVAAVSNGDVSSKKLRQGLMHKLGLIIAFALAATLEYEQTVLPIGLDVPLVPAVSVYIVLMESCSVYENVRKINPEFAWTGFDSLFEFSKRDDKNDIDETQQ